jgi:transforming growth factor-beta-induced protein
MKALTKIRISIIALLLGVSSYAADVVNMSARAIVGSEEETFIIGFVVDGMPGETVPMYLRGTGPTDNVGNPIANPNISIFKHEADGPNEVILGNDDWKTGGQMFAISATQIPPANDQGAAAIAMLEPGEYSFHLADGAASGGVGMAEAYEMTLNNIPGNLVNADDFTTLLAAINAALPSTDVAGILSDEGPFTLFAPTDAAFAKIPADTLNDLLADPDLLADILLYHAVVGEVPASAVANGQVMMANGENAIVQVTGAGGVVIQGANVIETDFMASNGIIHVVDTVILPASGEENIVDAISAAGNFSTLIQAAIDTGAAATLTGDGPFTLFAPSDEAFAALPEGTLESLTSEELLNILLYHVVTTEVPSSAVSNSEVEMANGAEAIIQVKEDGRVIIQGANVTQADILGTNGVVHFIDKVILPPSEDGTIVDTLVGAGNFATLLSAAVATGAADTLVTDGPFTLFAPTDDAFAALPEGTLESLSDEALLDILLYHVVVGLQVKAADVTAGNVTMGNGDEAALALDDGVTINESNVILTDLLGSNGVIHVIDKVLLPTM